MKYVLQDDNGKLYDADYPDGTAIAHIEAEASAELGLHVRHVDPAALAKQTAAPTGEPASTAREIARSDEALRREIAKADKLRATIEKLREDVAAAERRCTDAKHGKTEALAAAKNDAAKLYACEQALELERKARDKAEAIADRLRAEAKIMRDAPEPARIAAWTFEVVSRDANGFTREVRMVPEYSKVTVQ